MKIFTPNIKLVNELTRYIRPAEIEHARYKKFNAPIINDGNLLCDEFFRTGELFDKKSDIPQSFYPYSIEDIRAIDRTSLNACDVRRLSGSNAYYIESDLPYYVDIIGENKRVYLEKYGTKSSKYPMETDYDINDVWLNRDLYKGHSVDEIINIKYHATKLSQNDSQGLILESLKLLKAGYPLESVINIMKKSTVKDSFGDAYASRGLMQFIVEFPDLKRYMITYANNKSEVFDVFGAKMFPQLLELCNGDKKLAYRILWDCRKEMPDGSFMTDVDLLTIGQNLYKLDNTWNEKKAKIVQIVSLKKTKYYKYDILRIDGLLERNYTLDDIIKKVASYMPKKKLKEIEML